MTLLNTSTALAYVGLIIVQVLSNEGYFGLDNATVSSKFPTVITPAGWAFSIWGLIFGLQLWCCIYSFLPSRTENSMFWKSKAAASTFPWWMAGWALQCLWQVFFSKASPRSMLGAAVCIVAALLAFQKALANLHALQHANLPSLPSTVYAAFWVPTAINAAWLSVAASVQLIITIQTNTNIPPLPCAIALASAVVAAGTLITYTHKDMPYGLTLVWSFVAVFGARSKSDFAIKLLCVLALTVLLPVSLSTVLRKRTSRAGASPAASSPAVPSAQPERTALLSS